MRKSRQGFGVFSTRLFSASTFSQPRRHWSLLLRGICGHTNDLAGLTWRGMTAAIAARGPEGERTFIERFSGVSLGRRPRSCCPWWPRLPDREPTRWLSAALQEAHRRSSTVGIIGARRPERASALYLRALKGPERTPDRLSSARGTGVPAKEALRPPRLHLRKAPIR
jgi:hypothetical protein